MRVNLLSSSGRMLVWLGSRWEMRMKAMPLAGGMWVKNSSKASRPPAEAPIPTTGKEPSPESNGKEFPGRVFPFSAVSGRGPGLTDFPERALRGVIFFAGVSLLAMMSVHPLRWSSGSAGLSWPSARRRRSVRPVMIWFLAGIQGKYSSLKFQIQQRERKAKNRPDRGSGPTL